MFDDISHAAFLAAAKAAGFEPLETAFYCAATKRRYRYFVLNRMTHFSIHRRRSLKRAIAERAQYLAEQKSNPRQRGDSGRSRLAAQS